MPSARYGAKDYGDYTLAAAEAIENVKNKNDMKMGINRAIDKTYKQMQQREDFEEMWLPAAKKELEDLKRNNTYEIKEMHSEAAINKKSSKSFQPWSNRRMWCWVDTGLC